jgi:GNAT superfamily N-acetyltransferase
MVAEEAVVFLEEDGAVANELHARLQAWNETQIGSRHTRQLTLSARNADGTLIGGLDGELHWNAFYLGTLWVEEAYRGRGYGTALLERAETIAKEHPCNVVFLTTLTFQAPGFYEKRGYEQFGRLDYDINGLARLWLSKRL